MHYRNGQEVQIGDRVEPAPEDGAEPKIPDHMRTDPRYSGIVLGRDFSANSCGAVVASAIEDSPLSIYAALCSAKPALLVRCCFQTVDPKYLQKAP